jgi:hypothetical protein
MKKKITRTTAKTTRKATRKATSGGQSVLFQRIVIISACLTLFLVGVVFVNKRAVTQSVAGTSIMNGLFMQATIALPHDIPQAAEYNIYYRQVGEKTFSNAVRNVPVNIGSYTISKLKKGASYEYRFAALDQRGEEFAFSETLPLTDLQPM